MDELLLALPVPPPVPPLVTEAYALARQLGFPLTREEAQQGAPGDRSPGPAQRGAPGDRSSGSAQRESGQTAPDGEQPVGPSASLPGVGRFLAMLAAACHGGRIGEIGTGVGIGTAWMAGAMPADCTLVTVEIDARRAAASAQLLASDRRVRVLKGDARELLPPCGPFDLLFADGGWRDPAGLSGLVDLIRVGGQIVMDDVTPLLALPPDAPVPENDVKRAFFFGDPRLLSAEVVLPDLCNSLLVGTRLT
jgi:predicted O-methyltransferase YrrM